MAARHAYAAGKRATAFLTMDFTRGLVDAPPAALNISGKRKIELPQYREIKP